MEKGVGNLGISWRSVFHLLVIVGISHGILFWIVEIEFYDHGVLFNSGMAMVIP